MAGLSPQGEAAVLAAITGNAYISLHTADPGATGANEVTGDAAYVRQGPAAFANSGSNPTVAANSAIISFPVANNPWGVISYFGVWTDPVSGVFQGSGAITTPKQILAGDQARFLANSLTITAQ